MATVDNTVQGAGTFTGAEAQNISVIDLLCEGPILGLVNGRGSVYFNDVPADDSKFYSYQNTAATLTFNGTTGTVNTGGVNDPNFEGLDGNATDREIHYTENAITLQITSITEDEEGVTLGVSGTGFTSSLNNSYNPQTGTGQYHIVYWENSALYFGIFEYISSTSATIFIARSTSHNITVDVVERLNTGDEIYTNLIYFDIVQAINSANYQLTTLNAGGSGTYQFWIGPPGSYSSIEGDQGSSTFDPNAYVSKIEKLYIQENTGTINQEPFQSVGNVGGAISIQGQQVNKALEYFKPFSDYSNQAGTATTLEGQSLSYWGIQPLNPEGLPNVDRGSDAYPGNPDMTVGTTTPTTISATEFLGSSIGTGASLSELVKKLDRVKFAIQYPNGLVYIGGEDGSSRTNHAYYDVWIRFQFEGQPSLDPRHFQVWRGKSGLKHAAKRQGPLNFDHEIDLNRFREQHGVFIDFTVYIVRTSRHIGLPVGPSGGNDGKTDKNKWQTIMASNITGLSSTIEDKLSYPYSAMVNAVFSSRQFKQDPKRSYHIRGKLVKVPNIYTPREYSSTGKAIYNGFWDGTFTEDVYTNNPAWVFYDIITNKRYGAGKWIEESDIDIYSLYRISKYCDELVESNNIVNVTLITPGKWYKVKDLGSSTSWSSIGATGTVGHEFRATSVHSTNNSPTGKVVELEPRYTMNLFLTKGEAVYKVLRDIASAFGSILYWLDSKITVLQDAPSKPVFNFSKSNVIEGQFIYESTATKTRANQIIVNWHDPLSNYEPVPLIIEDTSDIAKRNRVISKEVHAMGCTSESQAIRYGRWHLWSGLHQTNAVTFSTALQGIYIKPGDVINIQDADKYGLSLSGRIKSFTSTEITLDRTVGPINSSTDEYILSTVSTTPSAIYAGLDAIQITDNSNNTVTYNKGDYIESAWIYQNNSWSYTNLTTEELTSNAYAAQNDISSLLPLVWKKYTHVKTYRVSPPGVATDTLTISANSDYPATSFDSEMSSTTVWSLSLTSNGANVLGSEKQYKVVSVIPDKNITTISAIEHYNAKFDAVDIDYRLGVIPPSIYKEQEPNIVPPPENVRAQYLEVTETVTSNSVQILWDSPDFDFIAAYEITAAEDVIGSSVPIKTSSTEFILENIPSNRQSVKVRTVSLKGNVSVWVDADLTGLTNVNTGPYDEDIERIYGIPKFAFSNVGGGIKNISATAGSTEEVFNWNQTYHGIYNKPTDTFSITQPTTDEFFIRQWDSPRRDRYLFVWAGEVVDELWVQSGDPVPNFKKDGILYQLGTLSTYANIPIGNNTYNYYKIKSENTTGTEGQEVWTFESFPAKISGAGDPDNIHTITEASGNGVVDLSGIPDGDPRELYIVYDESLEKIFLAEFDKEAFKEGPTTDSTRLGPGVWRDIGDGSAGLDTAFTSISGTATLDAYSRTLVGSGTSFLSDLEQGDKVSLGNLSSLTGLNHIGKGATVLNVVSDTEVLLDRSFPDTLNLTNLYRASYRPDLVKDAVIAYVDRE
jgi:hypothetical protein